MRNYYWYSKRIIQVFSHGIPWNRDINVMTESPPPTHTHTHHHSECTWGVVKHVDQCNHGNKTLEKHNCWNVDTTCTSVGVCKSALIKCCPMFTRKCGCMHQ